MNKLKKNYSCYTYKEKPTQFIQPLNIKIIKMVYIIIMVIFLKKIQIKNIIIVTNKKIMTNLIVKKKKI